ncbi:helix-turn-helix domain-containing protein [Chloroflexota bacterium]
MTTDSLVMNIPELAKSLGISRGLAYSLARQDSLPVPVIKCGRRLIVSRKSVESLLEGNGKPKES